MVRGRNLRERGWGYQKDWEGSICCEKVRNVLVAEDFCYRGAKYSGWEGVEPLPLRTLPLWFNFLVFFPCHCWSWALIVGLLYLSLHYICSVLPPLILLTLPCKWLGSFFLNLMFDGYIVDFQLSRRFESVHYSWNEALPNNLWSFFFIFTLLLAIPSSVLLCPCVASCEIPWFIYHQLREYWEFITLWWSWYSLEAL